MPIHRPGRRAVLKSAAGLALAPVALTDAAAAEAPPPGKPGDFDFLAGEWRIQHRRRPTAGADFEQFEGEATCWTILGGVGSVEELRVPSRNFMGMGLRLLDVEKKIWSDHWVNAKSGVVTTPGQTGYFKDGAGIFEADDFDGETPIKVKGVWDQITTRSCRWSQLISRDGGKSWEDQWVMDWRKA